VRPASKTDFRNFRPKKEDPAAAKSAEGEKKTNFMDNLEMPKDVTTIHLIRTVRLLFYVRKLY
jgi:hypothetical protein